MGEVVDLKPISLVDNQEFISDCCRFQEGIVTEKAVRKKYRMAESAWEALALDDDLVRAIEAESVRRIRDGSSKREKAQALIVKGPDILDSIASDVSASPRHRVDAIRTLDGMSSNGPAGVPAADRFVITINLGSDTLKFDKSIAPDPNDVDPHHIDDMPMIVGIAMNKPRDDGSGNPLERLQEKQLQQLEERQAETIPRGPLLQPIVPPATPQSSPSEKLLDFIVNRWPKPAIRVREICQFGPGSIRDRKSALALAETLVAHGWLAPLPPTRRYDEKRWRIVRGGEG